MGSDCGGNVKNKPMSVEERAGCLGDGDLSDEEKEKDTVDSQWTREEKYIPQADDGEEASPLESDFVH